MAGRNGSDSSRSDEDLELKEKKVCSSCFHAAPAEIRARSVRGAMPLDVLLEASIVTQDLGRAE